MFEVLGLLNKLLEIKDKVKIISVESDHSENVAVLYIIVESEDQAKMIAEKFKEIIEDVKARGWL
jgi:glutamate formiminotransferase